MSILKSNYEPGVALVYAMSIGPSAVKELVYAAGIREYGVYNDRFVGDEWQIGVSEVGVPDKIIGALNNCDTEKMLLLILKENTAAVIEGLTIAAYATNAERLELVLPEKEDLLGHKIEACAQKYGIKLVISYGIVDVRAEEKSIIHHIVTASMLTELFAHHEAFLKTMVVAVKKANQPIGEPVEMTYGKTIGEIIGDDLIRDVKAIGVGTQVYDASSLNVIIDENFPLGNGVITVYDTKCCMAYQAEKEMLAIRKIGCGKCTFCREGAIQIGTRMMDITKGKGRLEDISLMKEIGNAMVFSSLCSVGQTGANFALGTLHSFGEEIEAHIRNKFCVTQVCSAFKNIYINPLECDGCGDCMDNCQANCIEGKPGFIHMIDEFDCTKCGKCIDVCPQKAILTTTGRIPKLPDRLSKVGRFKK